MRLIRRVYAKFIIFFFTENKFCPEKDKPRVRPGEGIVSENPSYYRDLMNDTNIGNVYLASICRVCVADYLFSFICLES